MGATYGRAVVGDQPGNDRDQNGRPTYRLKGPGGRPGARLAADARAHRPTRLFQEDRLLSFQRRQRWET